MHKPSISRGKATMHQLIPSDSSGRSGSSIMTEAEGTARSYLLLLGGEDASASGTRDYSRLMSSYGAFPDIFPKPSKS